jgi:hypothetical protein
MTSAVLELNDQALLIQAEDGALHAEPGYARLTAEGVVTGEEVRAIAWREPQHVYNGYWCNLNQTPLPVKHRFARHHADIAFAQLRKLWRNAGSPESLLILVPGSFAASQLSLLLGMVEALPCRTAALIDSALAACLDNHGETLYLDLQMHESVLTVCRTRGGAVEVAAQEVFPGLGMVQIQNSVARHISDLLIESYCFDPLHSSESEQAIFDQIPHWLTKLRWEAEVSIKLTSDFGEHPCILRRDAIRKLIGDRLDSVRTFLGKWPDGVRQLSHASGLLTGLAEELSGADVLDQTAAAERCMSRRDDILDQVEDLYLVRSLQRPGADDPDVEAGENGEPLATHLLCGDFALPLNSPVSIRMADDGPSMSAEIDDTAALTVVLRNRSLEALRRTQDVSLPPTCRAGESIGIGEHRLRLIRVGHD